jgi:hypothetical protein
MKKLIVTMLFTFLVACGSSPKRVVAIKAGDELYKPDDAAAQALDTGSSERIVCQRRIVTGSHRKEKICTTERQMELDKQRSREMIDRNKTLIEKTRAAERGG